MEYAKIIWEKQGLRLRAAIPDPSTEWVNFLTDAEMLPIQEWSDDNKCGLRISFDTFRFRTEEEMTVFLLVWS